ncbi:hypothetical protein SeMB42_g02650 [Synchytrium endobioticum]|uniref:ubiquitinyl hydrolase 1 n=1 Tax=Synchytrium endobioticum TaxID=286115 RepID=A0A507DA30_9FUNG|nr:hypothetical protein SeLEV6574_g02543 [Synchytrium endobioticum]TPX49336.1 hypothetical protein SeMB42_g02650 [Synchytrium endobioticum]
MSHHATGERLSIRPKDLPLWDSLSDPTKTIDEEDLRRVYKLNHDEAPYCVNKFSSAVEQSKSSSIPEHTDPPKFTLRIPPPSAYVSASGDDDCIVADDDPYTYKTSDKSIDVLSRAMVKDHTTSNTGKRGKGRSKSKKQAVEISEANCGSKCSFFRCRDNPNCSNHLGQDVWLQHNAFEKYLEAHDFSEGSLKDRRRDPNLPVGLTNLGATCYLNTLLQIWYHNTPFRDGVYQFQKGLLGLPEKDAICEQLQFAFAKLQLTRRAVFSPRMFIESMHLNPGEQQDAQEFSKLLLSSLEESFGYMKGSSSLVEDLFEGTYEYVTTCKACNTSSVMPSRFHELELPIKDGGRVDECLEIFLKGEVMEGDNQYFCQKCGCFRDANRRQILRKLPKVLTLHLIRFIYDPNKGQKKKVKHLVDFKNFINMRPFLGSYSDSSRQEAALPDGRDDNVIYDLRAILLHRGNSANSGHYTAKIYDESRLKWFDFDDEVVTVADILPGGVYELDDNEFKKLPGGKEQHVSFKSRNAYILTYVRRPTREEENSAVIVTTAPPDIVHQVLVEDENFEISIKDVEARKAALKSDFESKKSAILDVCSSWEATPDQEPTYFVDSHALKDWLTKDLTSPATDDYNVPNPRPQSLQVNETSSISANPSTPEDVSRSDIDTTEEGHQMDCNKPDRASSSPEVVEDPDSDSHIPSARKKQPHSRNTPSFEKSVLRGSASGEPSCKSKLLETKVFDSTLVTCSHGKLDPLSVHRVKRINAEACQKLEGVYGYHFMPVLSSADSLCYDCVKMVSESKQDVKQHEEDAQYVKDHTDDEGAKYWISKPWFNEWKKKIPKFRSSLEYVPPNAPAYASDVYCEHGDLAIDFANRKLVSEVAVLRLKELFPEWETLAENAVECEVCLDARHRHKKNTREQRERADREKNQLRRLMDTKKRPLLLAAGDIAYIVNADFIKEWQLYIDKAGVCNPPSPVDNGNLICDHGFMKYDLNNPDDVRAGMWELVSATEWKRLQDSYGGGPELKVSYDFDHFFGFTQMCVPCWYERRRKYTEAKISVQRLDYGEQPSIPQAQGEKSADEAVSNPSSRRGPRAGKGAANNNRKRKSPPDQPRRTSKRRHKNKTVDITITKTTTVRDLKVMLMDSFDVVPIYQKLYYNGKELDINEATMGGLDILPGCTLELKIFDEKEHDGDDGGGVRAIERGFQGSLLTGIGVSSPIVRPPASSNSTVGMFANVDKLSENGAHLHDDVATSRMNNDPPVLNGAMHKSPAVETAGTYVVMDDGQVVFIADEAPTFVNTSKHPEADSEDLEPVIAKKARMLSNQSSPSYSSPYQFLTPVRDSNDVVSNNSRSISPRRIDRNAGNSVAAASASQPLDSSRKQASPVTSPNNGNTEKNNLAMGQAPSRTDLNRADSSIGYEWKVSYKEEAILFPIADRFRTSRPRQTNKYILLYAIILIVDSSSY